MEKSKRKSLLQRKVDLLDETFVGVPAFLAKLWCLVDDPLTNGLICWSKDGRSFIIHNEYEFASKLLPVNYKHNKMSSFIRQLNMYGFHKITSIHSGALTFDRDKMQFSHPCFKKNCSFLLDRIKRKIANVKQVEEFKPESVSKVLQDVKAMRGRQDSFDSRLSVMKQENKALLREVTVMRKKQQILNKVVHFLFSFVPPSPNMTGSQHKRLMINDVPEHANKLLCKKIEPDGGPEIDELSEDELTQYDSDLMDPNSPYAKMLSHFDNDNSSEVEVKRPESSISLISHNLDCSNQSEEDARDSEPAPSNNTSSNNTSGLTTVVGSSSIIQSVNPDGSQIVYHVTEVPDAHPQESLASVSSNCTEENVLTTPLVRQEMERSQLLKRKNKQRRKQTFSLLSDDATTSAKAEKLRRKTLRKRLSSSTQSENEDTLIKSEDDVDPMEFLSIYSDEPENVVKAPLISPNLSEDSCPSNGNDGTVESDTSNTNTKENSNVAATSGLYNPNSFVVGAMPADLFEDSSLISCDNSNLSGDFGPAPQKGGNKFSLLIGGNNGPSSSATNGASTSAAAASNCSAPPISVSTALIPSKNKVSVLGDSSNRSSTQDKSENNMIVARNKKPVEATCDPRLSTVAEGTENMANVHDNELETLKDLLRNGDSYTLDASTLMGKGTSALSNNSVYLSQPLEEDFMNKLFNDSDLMDPYCLSMPTEAYPEKRVATGSELIAYQPSYDFSELIDEDINEKNECMDSGVESAYSPGSSNQGSVLNTPYHE